MMSTMEAAETHRATGDPMNSGPTTGLCWQSTCFRRPTVAAPHKLVCDVDHSAPDIATIAVLARLQLTARRRGRHVELRHASPELQDLLTWTGLADVLPLVLPVTPRAGE